MLLSFRSRLRVSLGAEHVQLQSYGSWRQPAARSATLPANKVEGARPWEAPLAAWRAHMTEQGRAGRRVDVVIADCFARYVLVPWPGQMLRRDELAALVRIQFENLYGDAARTWTYRCDMRRYGEAGIACAIDPALLEAVEVLCADTGSTLASLQPQLMHVLNAANLPLQGAALFALAADGAATLAARDDSGWRSIRTVRYQPGQLRQTLEREGLLQGLPAGAPVYLAGLPASQAEELRGMSSCTVLREGDMRAGKNSLEAA